MRTSDLHHAVIADGRSTLREFPSRSTSGAAAGICSAEQTGLALRQRNTACRGLCVENPPNLTI